MSKQVKAVSNIKHDGIEYEGNDVFSVDSDVEAQALVDAGAAKFVEADTPKKGGKKAESLRVDKNAKEAARVKAENDAKLPNIDWSRVQLDDHARTLGIDPADMPNKAAVLAAIEKNEQ